MLESEEITESSFFPWCAEYLIILQPLCQLWHTYRLGVPLERWAPAGDWGHGQGLAVLGPVWALSQLMVQTELWLSQVLCSNTAPSCPPLEKVEIKVQVLAVDTSLAWTSFHQEGHHTSPSAGEMTWHSWGRCWCQNWKNPFDSFHSLYDKSMVEL